VLLQCVDRTASAGYDQLLQHTAECPGSRVIYIRFTQQVLPFAASTPSTRTAAAAADHAAAVIKRFGNQDIVSANEQVVLIGPFNRDDPSNRWTSPQLGAAVQDMWADAELQAAAADMLQLYRSSKQALIHNDLHAGMRPV
jgi:5-methylthioribose kinase